MDAIGLRPGDVILRLGAVEVDSAAEALRILSAVPSAGDIEMDYVTGEETPNADHLRALVQIDAEAHAPERRKGLLRVLWDNVPLRIGNALWGLVVAVQWTFLFLLAVSLRVIKAGLFVTVVPVSSLACFISLGVKFILKDLIWDVLLTDFDSKEVKREALRPFKCPRNMYDFWAFHFARPDKEFILGPARFATVVAGSGPASLMAAPTCGENAYIANEDVVELAFNTVRTRCQCVPGHVGDRVTAVTANASTTGSFVAMVQDRSGTNYWNVIVDHQNGIAVQPQLMRFSALPQGGSSGASPLLPAVQHNCLPPLISEQPSGGLGCRCKAAWLYSPSFSKGNRWWQVLGGVVFGPHTVRGCFDGMCEVDTSTCGNKFRAGQKKSCTTLGKFHQVDPMKGGRRAPP
jgi:hypothetical protein